MKLFAISIGLVLLSVQLSAQGTPPPPPPQSPQHVCPHQKPACELKKHEIGLGVVSNFDGYNPIYPWYILSAMDIWNPYPMYVNRPAIALNYRLHNPNGAYRFSVQLSYEKNNYTYNVSETKDDRIQSGINSGYEWHNNYKKFQLFYGADLFVNYGKETSSYSDTSAYSYSTKNEKLSFGVSPLIGLRYYMTPYLSISTESYFRVSHYQSDYSTKSSGIPYNSSTSGFKMGFSPFGMLSMGLHF